MTKARMGLITLTEVKKADYVPPKFKLVKEDGYTVIDTLTGM